MVGTDLLYMPSSYGTTDHKYDACLDNFVLETRFEPQGASNENSPTDCLNKFGNKNISLNNTFDSRDKNNERMAQYTAAVRALYETSSDESEITSVLDPSAPKAVKPKFWLGAASPEPAQHYACTTLYGDGGERRRRKKTVGCKNSTAAYEALEGSTSSGCSSDEKHHGPKEHDAVVVVKEASLAPINRCAAMWDLKRLCKNLPPVACHSTQKPNRSGHHHRLFSHKRSSSLNQNENKLAPVQMGLEPGCDINVVNPLYVKGRSLSLSTQPAPTLLNMNIVSASLENEKTSKNVNISTFRSSSYGAIEKSKDPPPEPNNANGPRVVVVTQEAELYRSPWLRAIAMEEENPKKSLKSNAPKLPYYRRPDELTENKAITVLENSVKSHVNYPTKLFYNRSAEIAVPYSRVSNAKPFSNTLWEPNKFCDDLRTVKTPIKHTPSPFSSLRVGGSSSKMTNGRASILHARTLPTTTTCTPNITRISRLIHSQIPDLKGNKVQTTMAEKGGIPSADMSTPELDLNDIFDNLDTVLQNTLDTIANTRATARSTKTTPRAPTVRSHSVSVFENFDNEYDDNSKPIIAPNFINNFNKYSHNCETLPAQDVKIVDESLKRGHLNMPSFGETACHIGRCARFSFATYRDFPSFNRLENFVPPKTMIADFDGNSKTCKPENVDIAINEDCPPLPKVSDVTSSELRDLTIQPPKRSLEPLLIKALKQVDEDKPMVEATPFCCEPKIITPKAVAATTSLAEKIEPPRHHYTFSTICTTSGNAIDPTSKQEQSFSAPWRRSDKRPAWYSQYISSTLMGGNRKAKKSLGPLSNIDSIFSTLPTSKPITTTVQDSFEKVNYGIAGRQHNNSSPLKCEGNVQESNSHTYQYFDDRIPIPKKRSHFSLSLSMTERDWPPPPSFPPT